MSGRPFVKMQGLENHFVIVDARTTPFDPDANEITRICDVRIGIGAEQLLILNPPSQSGKAAGADAFLRILNIDGKEVSTCGNASRCAARLLMEQNNSHEVLIETGAGILTCQLEDSGLISVDMGLITTDWQHIPLTDACDTLSLPIENGPLNHGIALNIGNPHAVFFVEDFDSVDIETYAPAIQDNPLFPEQVNVGVAQITGPDSIRMHVFERPGILTRACGSGACVAVEAARLTGRLTASRVRVEVPAGTIEVYIREDHSALMAGPAEYCFSGHLLA